ncbi:MAG: bifunctional tetrahydrofolate synthase/dihydrofolate synthase [Verrucomicrobiaceae bacterium]|nr:bifunctional tetrahydrofolate synthase/dihydrofolate synthase [Verrucomicrobiaceae bacterium]
MPERTLEQWLLWMEAHHPRQIELGLERVAAVVANLTLDLSGAKIITVGGTNGKGSCVAILESITRAAGYRVGTYTSPHLLRYNERVRIDGNSATDAELCAAFTAVQAALNGISLTYFEFGTLAALWLFQRAQLDVIVLEVGLGGRLDAVNIIDADVAVLTLIDLDHQDWLGNDRETIGREKAGIFRANKPAICVDPNPPQTVVAAAQERGANWYASGEAFGYVRHGEHWSWSSANLPHVIAYDDLPLPSLPLPSAAAALAALHCLPLSITAEAITHGLRDVHLFGRFQRVQRAGVEIILDVGHNPQAARWLAQQLTQLPPRRTVAVFAIMADKDVDAVIESVQASFTHWFVGDLPDNPRALTGELLEKRLRAHHIDALTRLATVAQAYAAALQVAQLGDRIVVFGSFFTVAAALALLHEEEITHGG